MIARPRPPAQERIQAMFDEIVPHYDLLNSLMALGFDRHWRSLTAQAVANAPAGPALDLGCGTGALTLRLGSSRPTVGMDVSAEMLRCASARFPQPAPLVRGSAFALPFGDRVFSGVVSGFVLRNLDDLQGAFREVARVLKPAGRVALLDATAPQSRLVRPFFSAYFNRLPPLLGRLTGHGSAYKYLSRSLAHLPPPPELCAMLEEAGLGDARYRSLMLGAVTLFTATKR